MRTLKRVSAPSFPAVSSAQLREWLRLDPSVDQSTLDLLLGSAVDHVQSITGQTVVSSVYETVVSSLGCHAVQIANITAVQLLTSTGTPIDPADAEASVHGDTIFVEVGPDDPGPVTVRITAGWTDEHTVPEALRHAIAVFVGAAYDTRHDISDATFQTIRNICRPYWRPVL